MSLRTPIYPRLAADGAVTAICGTRIYPNAIPQGQPVPAVVYQQVSGAAENYLGEAPGIDYYRVQIDCYATDEPTANALASAVRANLEQAGNLVSYNGQEYEPETKRFRYGFDFGFFVSRN